MPRANRLFPLLAAPFVLLCFTAGTWIASPGKGSHASAGGFPLNGVLDDFNRADQTPIAGNWSTVGTSGTWAGFYLAFTSLRDNTGSSLKNGSYWSASSFAADQEVYVTLSTKPADGAWLEAMLRIQNPTVNGINAYTISLSFLAGTDTIQVIRKDADVNTNIGAAFSQEISSGDSFGATMVGSTITVYYKSGAGAWTSLGTRTDSTYSSGGNIGLSADGSGPAFVMANFGGGNR